MSTRYSVEEVDEPKDIVMDRDTESVETTLQEEHKNDEQAHNTSRAENHNLQTTTHNLGEKPFWSQDEQKNGFEHEGNISQGVLETKTSDINPGIEQSQDSSSGKRIIWIAIIVLATLLIVGGVLWYLQSKNSGEDELAATPLATAAPIGGSVSTPTPKAAVTEAPNYADYKAQVLNGSGISGEAGKVQTILENLGFTDIDTGNAKSFSYKKTQIQAKKDTPQEVLDGVKAELAKKYEVEVTTPLDKTDKHDIVIIVGSLKAN